MHRSASHGSNGPLGHATTLGQHQVMHHWPEGPSISHLAKDQAGRATLGSAKPGGSVEPGPAPLT
jgi:hypothetical protein